VPYASPLRIPESLYLQICHASSWLCPSDRDPFWAAVAAELAGREIGAGNVSRAIRCAFKTFYRPIEIPEEPRHYRGERSRLEAEFDRMEANRHRRRQRVDAR
jgi:hypothetical protein